MLVLYFMISCGCEDFDIFLDGGFKKGLITLIYGPASSGKTTLCLQTALNLSKVGRVLYIDTENSFSVNRLEQMDPMFSKLLDKITVFKLKSFEDQIKCFNNLEDFVRAGKFDVVIVDTIGMHYRKALQELEPEKVNKSLIEMLRTLKHIADDHNIPVLMTNQVYSDMNGETKVVGGRMLKNFGKTLIELKLKPRRAVMLKPSEKYLAFEIKNEGIVKVS